MRSTSRTKVVLGLVGGLLTLGACAGDGEDLAEENASIIGGQSIGVDVRRSKGLVDVDSPLGGCSGSLLTRDWVLTASHCLDFATPLNNSFALPRASGVGTLRRRAVQTIRMEQSDVSLAQLEAPPASEAAEWPAIARLAYDGDPNLLVGQTVTCFGRGNTAYRGGPRGGLTGFGEWRMLSRNIEDLRNNSLIVNALGDLGGEITAPGDSGGLCTDAGGHAVAVVSWGTWSCADPANCKGTITNVRSAGWYITSPFAGMINALPQKRPATTWSSDFSDVNGWNSGPQFYSTIRLADVDGDHRDDVCGRSQSGIVCGRSNGESGFSAATVWSSDFSDAAGWAGGPQYYGTIRFPDVNGDGKADVCARGGAGIRCGISSGSGFAPTTVWETAFSDAAGWNSGPQYYSTIQFPDVNGDGKADVCGRGGGGIWCSLSNGSGFSGATLWTSSFGDGTGWAEGPKFYSTISFPDLDGDGRADVCGRGAQGIECAISTGFGFIQQRRWLTEFRDDQGWAEGPQYFATIRFVDVNRDHKADVCGRGSQGVSCALSNGSSFTDFRLWTSEFSDAGNWNIGPQYFSTIRFVDLDHDGRADVCGRGAGGVICATSNGDDFAAVTTWEPSFSDAGGWAAGPQYYSTIGFGGIDADPQAEICARGISGILCAR